MTEKGLEQGVLIPFVEMVGGQVDQFSQRRAGSCKRCGAALYAGSQQTPGIPDLRLVFPREALVVWIEVKWGRRKPTGDQAAWMKREIGVGGFAAPVWSLSDLVWVLAQAGVAVKRDVPPDEEISPATRDYVALWIW